MHDSFVWTSPSSFSSPFLLAWDRAWEFQTITVKERDNKIIRSKSQIIPQFDICHWSHYLESFTTFIAIGTTVNFQLLWYHSHFSQTNKKRYWMHPQRNFSSECQFHKLYYTLVPFVNGLSNLNWCKYWGKLSFAALKVQHQRSHNKNSNLTESLARLGQTDFPYILQCPVHNALLNILFMILVSTLYWPVGSILKCVWLVVFPINFTLSLTSSSVTFIKHYHIMVTLFTSTALTLTTQHWCCCCLWSSNLLSWMRDSALSVCERAHGRGDKIVAMVTTGCGLSQGMLG